jgi:hypothetical protein
MLGETEFNVIAAAGAATAAAATAIATVVSAILTGIVSILLKRRVDAQMEIVRTDQMQILEKIRSDLALENKVRGARIDYEYDARKRLYKEVEPILFSAHLAATRIYGRLGSLVDRIRDGFIKPGQENTWMKDTYYQRSMAYRLFLPMAHHRLLSRKISHLDLTLEPLIGRKFMVLGILQDIFVDHFDLAQVSGTKIPYEPYASVTEADRTANPGRYSFQGLVRGQVERLISEMIISDSSSQAPLEWFRFDHELNRRESELSQAYVLVAELLEGFHAETRPILWRVFLSFSLLSEFFVRAQRLNIDEYDAQVEKIGWTRFDYRAPHESEIISERSLREHFDAARLYIRDKICGEYETLSAAGAGAVLTRE